MATKLIRRNGQLVREEIPDASQPTTPAGTIAAGGTEQQAKMTGTAVQKEAVRQQSADTQTLSQAQRLQGPRTQATAAEDATTSKAARLSQLGGLGSRVESLVRSQFEAPMANAQMQLSPEMLEGYDENQQQLLQAVAAATTPEEREAALVGLANAGVDITTTPLAPLVQDMGTSLGEQGQEALGLQDVKLDPTVLEEFGGAEQIAADMGITPEELSQMNVNDFEAKLQELESNEFSKVEALKAELGGATPIRRQEILQELRAMGATGITGVEKGVENLQQQIEEADRVNFGGQEYELGDLLENDAISEAITSAVRDPAALEELAKTEPALAGWIEQNKNDLEAVVQDIEESQEAVRTTTENLRVLTEGANEEVQSAFGIDAKYMTAAELEEAKARLEGTVDPETGEVSGGNGAWQAFKEFSDIADIITEKPEVLNKLVKPDPDNPGATTPMSKDEIRAARDAAASLSEGPNAALLGRLIEGDHGSFITDAETQAKVAEFSAILDAMPTIALDEGNAGILASYIKRGEIDADLAARMQKDPSLFDRLVHRDEDVATYENVKRDLDSLLQFALGDDTIDAEGLSSKLAKAKSLRRIDADAAAIWKALSPLDTNRDGKIDDRDLSKLQQQVQGQLGLGVPAKELAGMKEGDLFASVQKRLGQAAETPFSPATGFLDDALSDGKITSDELRKMTPEQVAMALKGASDVMTPETWRRYKRGEANRAYEAEQAGYREQASNPKGGINVAIHDLGIEGSFSKGGNFIIDLNQWEGKPAQGIAALKKLQKEIGTLAAQATGGYRKYLNDIASTLNQDMRFLETQPVTYTSKGQASEGTAADYWQEKVRNKNGAIDNALNKHEELDPTGTVKKANDVAGMARSTRDAVEEADPTGTVKKVNKILGGKW